MEAGLMPLSALPYSEEAVFGAVRSLQAPASATGAERRRGQCQCAAFGADQLDPVRLALRALPQDDRPPHGGAPSRPPTRSRPAAGLADAVRQCQPSRPAGDAGALSAGERAGDGARASRASRAVFGCVVQLQPHYQLDDVAAILPLVTDIGGRRRQRERHEPPMTDDQDTAGALFRAGRLADRGRRRTRRRCARRPTDLGARVLLAELLAVRRQSGTRRRHSGRRLGPIRPRRGGGGRVPPAAPRRHRAAPVVPRRPRARVPGRADRERSAGSSPRWWPCGPATCRRRRARRPRPPKLRPRRSRRAAGRRQAASTICATSTICWPAASRC